MKSKRNMLCACVTVLISLLVMGCNDQNAGKSGGTDSKSGSVITEIQKDIPPISLDDFSIHPVDGSSLKISYGMNREEVEKILGQPSTANDNGFTVLCTYPSGIEILYRDSSAAAIILSQGSEGVYEAFRGLSVGMQAEEAKGHFKQTSELAITGSHLNYIYDSTLDDVLQTIPDPPKNHVFIYNIEMNSVTGEIQKIRLSDNQAIFSAYQR